MKKYSQIVFLFVFITTTNIFATTWDEPWAKDVIQQSSYFVLAKVISNDPEKGIKITILKTLGGNALKDTITITNFYALEICSSSGGHGAEFHTGVTDSCYFFLKQNDKGAFCIATPTTGFDNVFEGNVRATFRHSYHQALVPVSIYEKTMLAVFNNYHNLAYDKDFVNKFVNENLSKNPAGFDDNSISSFYLQHVTLECVYHLKLQVSENLLVPFLNDKNNFHSQVSAARALNAIETDKSKQELLKAISDSKNRDFVRVMCIWSITDFKPKEFKAQLKKIMKNASKVSDDFGGNIMDPRVCTHIPSLKSALTDLIAKL